MTASYRLSSGGYNAACTKGACITMDLYVIYLIVLRIVHIIAGSLCVGSAVYYFFFVEPTVKELGPVSVL